MEEEIRTGTKKFIGCLRAGLRLCGSAAALGAWFIGATLVDIFGPEP